MDTGRGARGAVAGDGVRGVASGRGRRDRLLAATPPILARRPLNIRPDGKHLADGRQQSGRLSPHGPVPFPVRRGDLENVVGHVSGGQESAHLRPGQQGVLSRLLDCLKNGDALRTRSYPLARERPGSVAQGHDPGGLMTRHSRGATSRLLPDRRDEHAGRASELAWTHATTEGRTTFDRSHPVADTSAVGGYRAWPAAGAAALPVDPDRGLCASRPSSHDVLPLPGGIRARTS